MMRLAGLSYVVIHASPEIGRQHTTGQEIQTLLIFDTSGSTSQSGTGGHNARDSRQEEDSSELDDDQAAYQDEPLDGLESNTIEDNGTADVDFEGSQEDLKDFVESLSENNTITREDYKMIMDEIK